MCWTTSHRLRRIASTCSSLEMNSLNEHGTVLTLPPDSAGAISAKMSNSRLVYSTRSGVVQSGW